MIARRSRNFGPGNFKHKRGMTFVPHKKQFGINISQSQLKLQEFNKKKREEMMKGTDIRKKDVMVKGERPAKKKGRAKGKRVKGRVVKDEGRRTLNKSEQREANILVAVDKTLRGDGAVIDKGGAGARNLVLISNLKRIRDVLRKKKQNRPDPAAKLKKLLLAQGK